MPFLSGQDVEQHHIEIVGAHGGDRLGARCCFRRHFHVGLICDELFQTSAYDPMIVSNENADHRM